MRNDLTCEVLLFEDSGEIILIGIIDSPHFLIPCLLMGFKMKAQASIRQLSMFIAKKGIDRACVNHSFIPDFIRDFLIVRIEEHLYIRMVKHAVKHCRKAMQRNSLIRVLKITIVPADIHRNPCGNRRFQLLRLQIPLLDGIPKKYFLIPNVQIRLHFEVQGSRLI